MKYSLHINQKQAMDLGITNLAQAHIFDLLTSCSTWAKHIIKHNIVYYWVARQKVIEEIPMLEIKSDTVYRHYKKLAELGLIDYQKDGKKDLIRLTSLGKTYFSNTMSEINPNHYVGNKSEKDENSDLNPNKLGNKSEKNSDLNPTYKTTIINNTTKINNVFVFWQKIFKKEKAKLDDKRKDLIEKRLKDYSEDDLKKAIMGCSCSDFHMGISPASKDGVIYESLKMIFRDSDQIEKFIELAKFKNPSPQLLPSLAEAIKQLEDFLINKNEQNYTHTIVNELERRLRLHGLPEITSRELFNQLITDNYHELISEKGEAAA